MSSKNMNMLKFIFYLYILLINNQIRFHLKCRPYRLFSSHNLSLQKYFKKLIFFYYGWSLVFINSQERRNPLSLFENFHHLMNPFRISLCESVG